MMGHKAKQSLMSSRIDFFYYAFRNVLLISVPATTVFALILSLPHSSARVSSSDNLAISVPSSCTLSSSVDEVHSASIINGTYRSDIGTTTLSTFCNDKNGYSVYAIGDSLNSEGNNTLVGSNGNNINSGTASSGDTSNWAMKLAFKESDTSPTPPTIFSPFDSYSTVPTTWTKVATIPSSTTDMEKGSNFITTYATYISPTQAAGTYLGQVKYLLTHPSAATPTSAYIMQEVAEWEDDLPNPGDSVQAIDIRDGKQYWVTRLADGNIWMTQNLDFNIEANTVLDSNTTDLNVAYNPTIGQYAEYSDGYTESNGVIYYAPASTATTIDFTGTTVPGWQDSFAGPYSANKTDSTETGHTSLGNYYNWSAAIASNNSSTLTSSTYSNVSNNPQNSICPRGWRLPTISSQSETTTGSTSEFARLNFLYNDNKTNNDYGLTINPLFFIKAGRIYAGSLVASGYGYYWSSTLSNSTESYNLNFSSGTVLPNDSTVSSYRIGGKSVRCIAR